MALVFSLRSTSLNAWYSSSGPNSAPFANVVDDPALAVNVNAGVFGGSVINMVPASVTKGLIFPGFTNVCGLTNNGTFSVICRVVPTTTANPFLGYGCIEVACSRNPYGFSYRCGINSAGKAYLQLADLAGNLTTYTGATINAVTINVPTEFMFTFDGTATAGAILVSRDGAALESLTSTNTCAQRVCRAQANIITGSISAGPTSTRANLNELLIWDTKEAYTYSVRTDFWNVATFDGTLSTDPGAATVLLNQTYYIAGVLKTGTLDVAAQVWNALTASYTTASTFGKLMQRLLTLAQFLGLK